MSDIEQYRINSEYNEFLNKLILWSLYRKVEADKDQGLSLDSNYEKMISFQERVQNLVPAMEKLDRSKIRSYSPLLDDIALIQYFKDTVGVSD